MPDEVRDLGADDWNLSARSQGQSLPAELENAGDLLSFCVRESAPYTPILHYPVHSRPSDSAYMSPQ